MAPCKRGLPYSTFFGKISSRFHFPVRTTLMALFFSVVYGLLYLFNTTAFNSIITSAVLYLVWKHLNSAIMIETNQLPRISPTLCLSFCFFSPVAEAACLHDLSILNGWGLSATYCRLFSSSSWVYSFVCPLNYRRRLKT